MEGMILTFLVKRDARVMTTLPFPMTQKAFLLRISFDETTQNTSETVPSLKSPTGKHRYLASVPESYRSNTVCASCRRVK